MAKDRKELEKEVEELEADLTQEEKEAVEAGEVALEDAPAHKELTQDERLRIGYKAVTRAEKEKDSEGGLSQSISDKYLETGRQMLDDSAAQPLDRRMSQRVEKIIGRDPGDVRIHTGEMAQKAASALGAEAFALGEGDVFFGKGAYAPNTAEGLGLLVHELTHATDSQVGAAFSTGDGQSQYSAAEQRAEVSQALAEAAHMSGELDSDAGDDAPAGEDTLDLKKLEDKVYELLERGRRRAGDRSGTVD